MRRLLIQSCQGRVDKHVCELIFTDIAPTCTGVAITPKHYLVVRQMTFVIELLLHNIMKSTEVQTLGAL